MIIQPFSLLRRLASLACSEIPRGRHFRSLREFARTQNRTASQFRGRDLTTRSPSPSIRLVPQSALPPQPSLLASILQAPPDALIFYALIWACRSCGRHTAIIVSTTPSPNSLPLRRSTHQDVRAQPHRRPQSRPPSLLDAPLRLYCATTLPIHSYARPRHFCCLHSLLSRQSDARGYLLMRSQV
jgi:hypothetical protein